jgi:hypothetical protein
MKSILLGWGCVLASPHASHAPTGTPDAIRPSHRFNREGGTTMPDAWNDKRERQYEHIKESYEDRGVSGDEAEERAARTVNKERREKGETKDSDDD